MRKSIGVLMLLSLVGLAGCATVPRLQPISDSGQWLPGKFIWRDLVTPTPYLSQKFYTALLGWKFEPVADSGYFVIQSAGEPIGGLVDANRLGRKPESAVWLSAVSVANVDEAVGLVAGAGGKVLQEPADIPGRGRTAVVADSAGAVLRLFHTEQGDPPDREAGLNQWLWTELIADDPAGAAAFYQAALGYEVAASEIADGSTYRVLKQSGRERAGILANPFADTRAAWIPCVRVASVKEAGERVVQQGGKLVVAPDEARRGGTVALVLDPGGAPLVLQEWGPQTEKGAAP